MADTPFVKDEPKTVTSGYGIAKDVVCKRLYNFDTGKHEFKAGHLAALKGEILSALTSSSWNRAYVVGHASRRGDDKFNLALSERRSSAVKDFLESFAGPGRVLASHRGETATLGKDENDPIDRAVVIIVQSVSLPLPPLIKDFPKGTPLPTDFDEPWWIHSVSGVSASGPLGGVSVGLSVQFVTLEQRVANRLARYKVVGGVAGAGVDPSKIPVLGTLLKSVKGYGGSVGPSSAPTWGSRVVMAPLSKTPVKAEDFAGSITITSSTAALGSGMSGSLVIFSRLPMTSPLGWSTVKGLGTCSGPTFSLGVGVDTVHGYASLTGVL